MVHRGTGICVPTLRTDVVRPWRLLPDPFSRMPVRGRPGLSSAVGKNMRSAGRDAVIPLRRHKYCDRKRILLFAGLLRSPPKQTAHFIHLKVSGITNSILVDSGSDETKKYVPMQNMYNTCNSLEALTGGRTFV